MKKIFALLITAALALALAACGSPAGPSSGSAEATAPAADVTEAPTEAPTSAEEYDAALIEEQKKLIIGEWVVKGMEDIERLTLNEDGTGRYIGIDKDHSFNYTVDVEHMEYGNGEPYDNYLLRIDYDNGVHEDIITFFTEQGQLAFHNSDDGGYSGVINYIDAWTKK